MRMILERPCLPAPRRDKAPRPPARAKQSAPQATPKDPALSVPWGAPLGGRSAATGGPNQSACFLRKAGISISSIPLLANASTFAAAVRPLRHTLGTDRL